MAEHRPAPLAAFSDDSDAHRSCYLLAARLAREAKARSLREVWEPGHAAGQAMLLRLLDTADQLTHRVIPLLRSQVRCEARKEPAWMRVPRGGRVDALRSLRRSPLSPPESWLVNRIQRLADSPVNLLIGAILGRVRAMLGGLQRQPIVQLPGERRLLRHASASLEQFLSSHPLGDVVQDRDPQVLLPAARRRPGEFRRLSGVVDWWGEVEALDLSALAPEGLPLGLGAQAAYEMAVVLAVRLAASRAGLSLTLHPFQSVSPGFPASSLVLRSADGQVLGALEAWTRDVPMHVNRALLLREARQLQLVTISPQPSPGAHHLSLPSFLRAPLREAERLLALVQPP